RLRGRITAPSHAPNAAASPRPLVVHLSGPALHPTRIVSIGSTAVAPRAAVSLARTATVKSPSGVRRKTTGSNGPAPKRMDRSACATPRARTTPATPPHTHPHDPL